MGAVDIADQLAMAYSKEGHTRGLRWVNVKCENSGSKWKCQNDHAEKPLNQVDFISLCVKDTYK